MNILTISGSYHPCSTNTALLKALASLQANWNFNHYDKLHQLPLYYFDRNGEAIPDTVVHFKKTIQKSDALIISTPAYLHAMPAMLKNALEWCNAGSEMAEKKVIALTYTPKEPRGKKALKNLVNSLKALQADVRVEMNLYQTDIYVDNHCIKGYASEIEMISEALKYLE